MRRGIPKILLLKEDRRRYWLEEYPSLLPPRPKVTFDESGKGGAVEDIKKGGNPFEACTFNIFFSVFFKLGLWHLHVYIGETIVF